MATYGGGPPLVAPRRIPFSQRGCVRSRAVLNWKGVSNIIENMLLIIGTLRTLAANRALVSIEGPVY